MDVVSKCFIGQIYVCIVLPMFITNQINKTLLVSTVYDNGCFTGILPVSRYKLKKDGGGTFIGESLRYNYTLSDNSI